MKKSLLWIVVLVVSISMIAAFSLSGCKEEAAEEEVAEEEEEVAEEEVTEAPAEEEAWVKRDATLTLMVGAGGLTEGLEAQLTALEEKTGIKVQVEVIPSGTESDAVIKSRIVAGEMPDIIQYNSGALLSTLNPGENFVDLSNESFMDSISDTFKAAVTVDGKIYGIPIGSANFGGWLYNKNIYEELGLQIPMTWDELMDNCQVIKGAGYTAVGTAYADSWTAQFILLSDYYNVQALVPDFAEKYTANQAKFADTPAALRSFEKLADIYDRGFVAEDFLTVNFADGVRLLAEGQFAHWPMGSFVFETLSAEYPDVTENDLGIFPQPSDDATINGFTTWVPFAYYVTKSCEDIDAAMEWLKFMISQEAVDAYASAMKISGSLMLEGITLPSNTLAVVTDMQGFIDENRTAPALEFISPIKGPNLAQICVEVGSGMKTALQGAEAYDEDVEKQALQLGIEGW